MRLIITVSGRPAPQGSKKLGGAGQVLEQSPYLDAWRTAVKIGTYRAYQQEGLNPHRLPVFPAGIPVVFEAIEFRLIKGKQGGSEQNADDPVGDPDVDKLLRATLDALGGRRNKERTARLFDDDAQVVRIANLSKIYATPQAAAGALIIVSDGRV